MILPAPPGGGGGVRRWLSLTGINVSGGRGVRIGGSTSIEGLRGKNDIGISEDGVLLPAQKVMEHGLHFH